FTYLWLIWGFSQVKESANFKATVRPPRLGGNQRVGVFASRSPFRPNRIALSAVKLEGLESDSPEGPKLIVSGIDMVDGTPIYDIKP
ncbi:SAM-dependent methyltransferase, partial [Streptococcus anginosus]|uniref:SAM-dependent methyltransferase n=1 Tax=Streptococcus anginosus TaxID=1328 RepID=UPI0021F8C0F8